MSAAEFRIALLPPRVEEEKMGKEEERGGKGAGVG
jgi:hypothetical protein